MVTTACALVWSTATNVDLVEVSTGYKVNYSGVVACGTAQIGQQSAGDTASGLAMSISGSTAKVNLFTASTYTGSNFTIGPISNQSGSTTCITLKSAGRWLVGSTTGMIVEVDSSNNVYKEIQLPQQPNTNYLSTATPSVCGLSYDGTDFLAVSTTAGNIYVYAYNTGTLLYTIPNGANASGLIGGSSLCAASSGTVFFGNNYTASTNNIVGELDFTMTPATVRDVMFLDTTGLVIASGCQATRGWVCQGTANKIHTFFCTSRNTTNVSSVIQEPAGTAVTGRIMRLVDDGVGTSYIATDTIIGAQSTSLPVPTGHSILEVAMINSGVDLKSSFKRNSE